MTSASCLNKRIREEQCKESPWPLILTTSGPIKIYLYSIECVWKRIAYCPRCTIFFYTWRALRERRQSTTHSYIHLIYLNILTIQHLNTDKKSIFYLQLVYCDIHNLYIWKFVHVQILISKFIPTRWKKHLVCKKYMIWFFYQIKIKNYNISALRSWTISCRGVAAAAAARGSRGGCTLRHAHTPTHAHTHAHFI